MASPQYRVGIERKILSTIVWVCILPIAVILLMGYVIARSMQSDAVQQTLLKAAQKTAEGIYIESQSRIEIAANLAVKPYVIHAVSPYPEDKSSTLFSSLNNTLLRDWLNDYRTIDSTRPSLIEIYDKDRKLVLSTDESQSASLLTDPIPEDFTKPIYNAFKVNPVFEATAVAPIFSPSTKELIGYLNVKTDIAPILDYAMGYSFHPASSVESPDVYQILYVVGDTVITIKGANRGPNATENPDALLNVIPTHETLKAVMLDRPQLGSMSIPNYIREGDKFEHNAFVAYQAIVDLALEDFKIYVLVYRPTANAYSALNSSLLMLTFGCFLFVVILCINAYRDVHNNIVRPVSLLNEGAQIIRQGDFDLKLKIDTNDEIEDLAMSFNKMAVALKSNIKQLENSEEKYRHLVTSLRDGIYQTDNDGRITFLNEAAIHMFGNSTLDQLMGLPIAELFSTEVDFDPLSNNKQLTDGDERTRMWLKRQSDVILCVEVTRNRLYEEGRDDPIGLEGTIRDITKSVLLENQARERSERISAINQIANVINSNLEAGRLYESLVAELRKIAEFDYAAVTLLNEGGNGFDGRQLWPEGEVHPGSTFSLNTQNSCAAWVAQEGESLVVSDLKRHSPSFMSEFPESTGSCLCVPLYSTGRIIGTLNLGSTEIDHYSKQMVETLEQMAPHLAVAIRNAQLLTNLQISLEDATRAREKLHEANEELKSLDEMKTNLLSNVSHELRTPLVSVMGYNDLILNGKSGPINFVQQEYLEISLRNIEKLVTLIENLLDFSRLHRGDERLIFDTFDLGDCAKGSIQLIQPMSDAGKVTIELIANDEPIWVDGDKGKMGQVFNNLLSNAVKFNDEGGSVTVELRLMNRSVEVIVEDTGIGIPEDALDKIFTRFYQYDGSSTRKYGGTGIGLAIAQDVVRLHGNTITATSVPNEGTTFRYTLSLSPSRVSSNQIDGGEGTSTDDTHILVELVTPDRAMNMQVSDILTMEGMDILHATTNDTAISLIQKHHPDCILIDMEDPELYHDFLLGINQMDLEVTPPVLILTTNGDVADTYAEYVNARVTRNFRKSTLLSSIHHAITKEFEVGNPIGHKILCVDDDNEIAIYIKRCLDSAGYESEQCSSGEDALEQIKSGEFGLVLLDISMPGIDGWETCHLIKSSPESEGIKVYMVTAKPIAQNSSDLKSSQADGFLLKPFHPDELLQLLEGLEFKSPRL